MRMNSRVRALIINISFAFVVSGCIYTDWPYQDIEYLRSNQEYQFSEEIAPAVKEFGVNLINIRPQSWMIEIRGSGGIVSHSLGEIDEAGLTGLSLDLLKADQAPEKWDLALTVHILSDTLETKSFKLGGKCGTQNFEVGRLEFEYELRLTSESDKFFSEKAIMTYIAHEPTCRRDY